MSWSIPSKEEAEEYTRSYLAAQEAYYEEHMDDCCETCDFTNAANAIWTSASLSKKTTVANPIEGGDMEMIDLEMVIKGLDSCAKWMEENDVDACDNCPYHHSHFSYDDNNCIAAVNKDAIALLKEQEPKTTFENGIEKTICGVCGSVLNKTVHSIPD